MFDPFFYNERPQRIRHGLWVSKSLVLKHGATIRSRSSQREGRSGTTFEVSCQRTNLIRVDSLPWMNEGTYLLELRVRVIAVRVANQFC
jgi:hypothetical protein